MSTINTIILEGHVGQHPKASNGGKSFSSFSLAVHERYKREGEVVALTTWVNIVCFGSLADFTNQYVKKGYRLFVEGRLSSSTWTDKSGNKQTNLQVVAKKVRWDLPKTGTNDHYRIDEHENSPTPFDAQ